MKGDLASIDTDREDSGKDGLLLRSEEWWPDPSEAGRGVDAASCATRCTTFQCRLRAEPATWRWSRCWRSRLMSSSCAGSVILTSRSADSRLSYCQCGCTLFSFLTLFPFLPFLSLSLLPFLLYLSQCQFSPLSSLSLSLPLSKQFFI